MITLSEDSNDHFSEAPNEVRAEQSSSPRSPVLKRQRLEDKENQAPAENSVVSTSGEVHMPLALSTQSPLAKIWKPAPLSLAGSSNSIPAGFTELVYNQQLLEAQRNRQILEAMRASSSAELIKHLMEFASKK